MGIIWTGLAPHPPIIVESVGGARCLEVQATINAMRALAQDLVKRHPQRLVLVSPHTPRPHSGIAAWRCQRVTGNLAQFGAPDAAVDLPVDVDWLNRFAGNYASVTDLGEEPLDHGAMVPLHFLFEAGWRGPTAVIGLPWREDSELDQIGEAAALACDDGQTTAVLASGDMSHCLKPGAPCGFDKRGQDFDDAFVAYLKEADYEAACRIDPVVKDAARQDVVESCRITWAASEFQQENHQFYSYEGPFGVGYTVMRFYGA